MHFCYEIIFKFKVGKYKTRFNLTLYVFNSRWRDERIDLTMIYASFFFVHISSPLLG